MSPRTWKILATVILTTASGGALAGPCDRLRPPVPSEDMATITACLRELTSRLETIEISSPRGSGGTRAETDLLRAENALLRAELCGLSLYLGPLVDSRVAGSYREPAVCRR